MTDRLQQDQGDGRQNFRHQLRAETRPHHDRLDALVSEIDIATPQGLTIFCRMHLTGFTALLSSAGQQPLMPLVTALKCDLAVLEGGPEDGIDLDTPQTDPLAVDYLVAGSRLGTQVLRQKWLLSQAPEVQAASHYFSLPPVPGQWPAVCAALAEIPVGSPRAERVTSDAGRLFDLFANAHRLATQQRHDVFSAKCN